MSPNPTEEGKLGLERTVIRLDPADPAGTARTACCIAVLIALMIVVGPQLAHAQPLVIEETVVPWDSLGRIDRIDSEWLRRLERDDPGVGAAVGAGTPGEIFVDTHLVRSADSTLVLDTLVHRGTSLVHRRRTLSNAEAGALLHRVQTALAVSNPRGLSSDYRSMLVIGSSLVGLGFYSWALPVSGNLDGKEAVAAGMFAVATSFFGPYLATRGTQVSAGEANLALYGGTRGIPHGILAYHGFRTHHDTQYTGIDGTPVTIEDDGDSEAATAAAITGSVLEGIGGFFWARGANLPGSTAHAIGVGGDIGLLWGLGYAELFDGDDDFWDIETNRPLCIAGLAGSGAGMALGSFSASHRNYTWGDVEVVRMSNFIGAATGLAIGDLVSEEDNPLLIGSLVESAAGLALGDRLVRDVDLSATQSILVDTGAIAGAALGLGLAYLLTSDRNDESEGYTSAAALGAIGGGGATFLAVRRAAGRADARSGSLELEFSPFALLARQRAPHNAPAMQLHWTF